MHEDLLSPLLICVPKRPRGGQLANAPLVQFPGRRRRHELTIEAEAVASGVRPSER
jgi:hypothetical protein